MHSSLFHIQIRTHQKSFKKHYLKIQWSNEEDMETCQHFSGQGKSRNMRSERNEILDSLIQVGGEQTYFSKTFYLTMKYRDCLGGIVGVEDITSGAQNEGSCNIGWMTNNKAQAVSVPIERDSTVYRMVKFGSESLLCHHWVDCLCRRKSAAQFFQKFDLDWGPEMSHTCLSVIQNLSPSVKKWRIQWFCTRSWRNFKWCSQ